MAKHEIQEAFAFVTLGQGGEGMKDIYTEVKLIEGLAHAKKVISEKVVFSFSRYSMFSRSVNTKLNLLRERKVVRRMGSEK